MAGDIAENSAVLCSVKEPVGPVIVADGVGAKTDGVDNLANRSLSNKAARLDRRRHLKMLGIQDAVYSPGGLLDRPNVGQLFETSHSRLVREDILSVLHRGN